MALYRTPRRVREILFQGEETVVNVGSPIHAILAVLKARFPTVHDGSAQGARSGERQADRR
jgi:hypothetical protein